MRHNADVNCIHCMTTKQDCLSPSKSLDANNGIDRQKRSVPLARAHMTEWNNAIRKKNKKRVETKYGVKPIYIDQIKNKKGKLKGGTLIENPLLNLFDFDLDGNAPPYGFDVYQDTPVDLFHLLLIGLSPTHIKMLHEVMSGEERSLLKEEMNRLNCRLNYDEREYWHGDNWLLFFSFAPFAYSKVLNSDKSTTVMKRHYKCLLANMEWMRILLTRDITLSDINRAEVLWYKWFTQM